MIFLIVEFLIRDFERGLRESFFFLSFLYGLFCFRMGEGGNEDYNIGDFYVIFFLEIYGVDLWVDIIFLKYIYDGESWEGGWKFYILGFIDGSYKIEEGRS